MRNKLIRLTCAFLWMLTLATVYYSPAAASTSQATTPRGETIQPLALTQTLVSLTSPIKRGAYATMIVRSRAGAYCTITVYYKSGPSSAKGLEPKNAGSDGRCTWTWKVGTATTTGTWQIVVKTGAVSKTYPFVVK